MTIWQLLEILNAYEDKEAYVIVDIGYPPAGNDSWFNTGKNRNTHTLSGVDTTLVPDAVVLEL